MDLIIKNALVITGDGITVLENGSIGIEDGRIAFVSQESLPPSLEKSDSCRIIDAAGRFVLPGIINTHTHGCTVGPLFSSAALPLAKEDAVKNANKHLAQGTTALINVCGIGLMEELNEVAGQVKVRILCGTSHFPSTFSAARLVDGKGLTSRHLATTAFEMLSAGAVALGEIGSGATLGGGVSCYKYIPEALEKETGTRITEEQATLLKNAALKKTAQTDAPDSLSAALKTCGLEGASPQRIRQVILDIVEKPVQTSLDSFDEAAGLGAEMKVPVIFHTAAESAERILKLARRYANSGRCFIAGHCNHTSFSTPECVSWARKFRELGLVVDISTVNALRGKRQDALANISALLSENLADTLTTDYGGGAWDGILELIQYFSKGQPAAAAKLVGMATGRAAWLFSCFSGRGFIQEGKSADIVISGRNDIGRVETVIIDGRVAYGG
jgi:hypothetical protein